MKKITALIMTLSMLLMLGACSSRTAAAENPDAGDIAAKIISNVKFQDQLVELKNDTVNKIYSKLDLSMAEDYCIYVSGTNATAEELAVIKLADSSNADAVKAAFEARIQDQKFRYENYNPQEMVKINDAVIAKKGSYIMLAVADDSAKCEKLFNNSIK